jgi:starch synthase (maltosyl-transferring)
VVDWNSGNPLAQSNSAPPDGAPQDDRRNRVVQGRMDLPRCWPFRPPWFPSSRERIAYFMPVASPSRVIIENVSPEVDSGRFPIKRTVGEPIEVTADIFADGHDVLAAVVRYREAGEDTWREVPLVHTGHDHWEGCFSLHVLGRGEYTLEAWIDRFASWKRELQKKVDAGQDVHSELLEGAAWVRQTADRAPAAVADQLRHLADLLASGCDRQERIHAAMDERLAEWMAHYAERSSMVRYDRVLPVMVEPVLARFGAWYEMFPRSASPVPGRAATLREAEWRLPAIAAMGFDVLYLPPIHPIGRSFRKGPNNSLTAGPNDPGSPWAIGAAEGGHRAIHPDLGTLDDFAHFVAAARQAGLEIALDLAFQCSPDHPYVREHPEWFRHRPDGTIKYAENPPKKYQDIYPLDFECAEWRALQDELIDVVLFWIARGVSVFRVDNPHTKPFRFWERLIREVKERHPSTIFLSEAFTRPKVMRYLAKCGFSQSYTYFTWRNTKHELTEYFTELMHSPAREYMRPNLFANTPDILHEFLQFGGRPAFQIRLILAATLGATYGIYGPAFELCEHRAIPGTEEYLDSEKYQIRYWDLDQPHNLRGLITRINRIRRENPALQSDWSLLFVANDNDKLLSYIKSTPDRSNMLLTVVSLDPHHTQSGWIHVPVERLGLPWEEPYQVHDLLTDERFLWNGSTNFVKLDPHQLPAHVFRIRRRIRSERDFDYFE